MCNRLRAIDSAIALAKKHKMKVHVIWEMNWVCNCKFSDLFVVPVEINRLTELKSGLVTNLLNKIAPILFSHFNNCFLDQKSIYRLAAHRGWFESISDYHNVYIDSYSRFYRLPSLSPYTSFNPRLSIHNIIQSYQVENMVGIHVRRTDHMEAIAYSPIERFIEYMNHEIDKDNDVKFFLSTDDPSVESELEEIFPEKIITHKKESLDRNNPIAIQDAVIDLFSLASCRKIIGSHWSTFFLVAAEINGLEKISVSDRHFSMAPFSKGKHSLMVSLNPRIHVNENNNGDLVVRTDRGKVVQLNSTSAAVLNVCYQSMTVTDILNLFRNTYPEAPESLEGDLIEVLESLFALNIVTVKMMN